MENQQLNALFDSMMSSRLQRATAAASRQPDSLDDMANQLQFDRIQQQQQQQLQHHHLQNSGNSYQNYDSQLSDQEWRGNE